MPRKSTRQSLTGSSSTSNQPQSQAIPPNPSASTSNQNSKKRKSVVFEATEEANNLDEPESAAVQSTTSASSARVTRLVFTIITRMTWRDLIVFRATCCEEDPPPPRTSPYSLGTDSTLSSLSVSGSDLDVHLLLLQHRTTPLLLPLRPLQFPPKLSANVEQSPLRPINPLLNPLPPPPPRRN
jgi:hypothetical protein